MDRMRVNESRRGEFQSQLCTPPAGMVLRCGVTASVEDSYLRTAHGCSHPILLVEDLFPSTGLSRRTHIGIERSMLVLHVLTRLLQSGGMDPVLLINSSL